MQKCSTLWNTRYCARCADSCRSFALLTGNVHTTDLICVLYHFFFVPSKMDTGLAPRILYQHPQMNTTTENGPCLHMDFNSSINSSILLFCIFRGKTLAAEIIRTLQLAKYSLLPQGSLSPSQLPSPVRRESRCPQLPQEQTRPLLLSSLCLSLRRIQTPRSKSHDQAQSDFPQTVLCHLPSSAQLTCSFLKFLTLRPPPAGRKAIQMHVLRAGPQQGAPY